MTEPDDGVSSASRQLVSVAEPEADETSSARMAELLAAVADGDRDAFTVLYRRTSHRVFGLALRTVRNRATAEEITQEVYLQVWSLAGRYDERMAGPIGWLMMLTHRRTVDRIRADSAASGRETVYGVAVLSRDYDSVSEAVEQTLEERAVRGCLGTLTPVQRETIMLAYYGGLTYPEVAERLGIPLATVKARIRDGLKKLSVALSGRGLR
ncbi:ECF RNA polymerase sigma factor SigK [Nocardia sp. BMG111209]|uniref:ECF RNA polymerase sigma factor SigK n=1 Tax=Nocardia sp. BMG111209 TaxID=1160137 RepID=UPI000363E3DF|nr:ECF RNA polymerase sigma factor SigK [Nocardia sp. BMG111209]